MLSVNNSYAKAAIHSRRGVLIAIYIPWLLAECLQFNPVVSYFTSWLGSFIVFYFSLISPLKYHSIDRPLKYQILRPIVLIQLIFAGFMCCTSIFYFMDHMGYEYLSNMNLKDFETGEQTQLIAKCQRITLLAHSTLVAGIILQTKRHPVLTYKVSAKRKTFIFNFCIITYATGVFIGFIPGLIQFKYMLLCISISTSAYILVKGLVNKQILHMIFGGSIFILNFMNTTLTGYKEAIITNIILLGFLAFPYYKKTIAILCIPCIYLILYILPTFTNIIRIQSWSQGKSKETAREHAYQTFFNEENDQKILDNNWEFLTNRFSETAMFTTFLNTVPQQHPYYELEILINSCYAIIPRIFWEEKPDTEKLAMERVYLSGVAHRSSTVSAKTRPVIDGYLSAGVTGVFIYMLIYGMLAQGLCNIAENLFGGYQLGCVIIFNSVFQPLWRGNTLEFMLNNIFYGYILMLIIHLVLKQTKTLYNL